MRFLVLTQQQVVTAQNQKSHLRAAPGRGRGFGQRAVARAHGGISPVHYAQRNNIERNGDAIKEIAVHAVEIGVDVADEVVPVVHPGQHQRQQQQRGELIPRFPLIERGHYIIARIVAVALLALAAAPPGHASCQHHCCGHCRHREYYHGRYEWLLAAVKRKLDELGQDVVRVHHQHHQHHQGRCYHHCRGRAEHQ